MQRFNLKRISFCFRQVFADMELNVIKIAIYERNLEVLQDEYGQKYTDMYIKLHNKIIEYN